MKARGVERVDGKGSAAALRAGDAAGEEAAGAARGVGQGGVDDLDKLGVARGKRHEGKDKDGGSEGAREQGSLVTMHPTRRLLCRLPGR